MKSLKIKNLIFAFLSVILFLTLVAGLVGVKQTASAYSGSETGEEYSGAYRNRLAFSAKSGWNNDPNGLLYVNGTWHMYYQYNYDQRAPEGNRTALGWGNMSWGHATSTDLVHWTEKDVAIPAYQDVEGTKYDMMFSGSAVYDEYNTSGLFKMGNDGKVKDGQGIVAILTQPTDKQRQILAYSLDNGDSFKIYGEVIGADNDGGVGDNEFRDPKVFWNDTLGKWLAVIGGGSIRMYSSSDLKKWDYLGATGYWGECPDISRYTVDGEQKYVLIMSPEDKDNSHIYNRTTRESAYYPAEYYVVGDLDENGLFVSDEPVRRLSEGIDSYALQTFNNAPDGKVYAVSWSASWKTCGLYESIRKTYNGGMTIVTELDLVKDGEGYRLTRNPITEYEKLRGSNPPKTYSAPLKKGENALADVKADVGDLDIELDFTNSQATYAELWLRTSAVENIKLTYNVKDETLTLDRSQSSLLAKDTALYTVPYSKHVALNEGKLSLRVLLDRAFISVFADGGKASFFSAVFPSAISNGMRLFADGDIGVKAKVYELNSIFKCAEDKDLILSTNKIDGTIGTTYPVTATFFDDSFNESKVNYEIVAGEGKIKLAQVGSIAYITPLKKETTNQEPDFAKVTATYEGASKDIEIFIYNNSFESDVDYKYNVGGFSYYGDRGLFLTDGGDAFRFSDASGESFIYSAEFTPRNADAQAAGLVFGVSDNLTAYYVATADAKLDKVKLWAPGMGELKTVNYKMEDGAKIKLTLVVNEGIAKIFVNNETIAQLVCKLPDYHGGKLGLNVFNGEFDINKIGFARTERGNGIFVNGYKVKNVYNLTDNNYKLKPGEYVEEGGAVALSDSYLKTLGAGENYRFRVVTEFTDLEFDVTPDFADVSAAPAIEKYYKNDDVIIELAGQAKVSRLTIDGVDTEFTQSEAGDTVVIAAEKIASLSMGKHTVKLYTDLGRPEVTINISQAVETIAEPVVKATHLFFYIDIAIFGSVIIGYIVITIIKKYKKKSVKSKSDK